MVRAEATLRAIVGAEHVLADPEVVRGWSVDWTGRFGVPAALVVRPGSVDEVAAVMRAAAEHRLPLVPQGGNTGLVGGGVPGAPGQVVLSLRRLRELGEVDGVTGQVTVGAGVTIAELHAHARAAGWAFGVDHAARDTATVGGAIATNAGGVHVVRYGTMRAQVAGVEAVLADGSVVGSLGGLVKDTAGYDLAGALVGSEGTLGVITRARLRLVPEAPARATAMLRVRDGEAAVRAVGVLRRRVPSLLAVEGIFGDALALAAGRLGVAPPFAPGGVAILVEAADVRDPEDDLVAALELLGEDAEAVAVAQDARQRDALWALRDGLAEAIASLGVPHKLDVAVPVPRLPELARRVEELVAGLRPSARVVLFGHLGDGNLHVNVVGAEADDVELDAAVLTLVADLGGTISAEHGVGRAKREWLGLVRSDAEIAAMRALKQALDPAWLLNPGAVLP